MKKILTIICISTFLLSNNSAIAQKQTSKAAPIREAVKLNSTNERSVTLLSGFFTPAISKKILQQISANKLADVKLYCNEDAYPDCIKDKLAFNPAKPDEDASEATLKSLKLYRIAKFDNIHNGENFGEESILIAPAKENKNVGGDCNFTKDFYIIIYSSAIEIVK
jgi:RNA-binding protein YlmH